MLNVPLCESPARLEALARYQILDTPPEPAFDGITQLVCFICDTPAATITLVDGARQWFKSEVGLGVRETPLEHSICARALEEPELLLVPDVRADPRFADWPIVAGPPHLGFYAGAVLRTPDGVALGTLCVLDFRPRQLSAGQITALITLGQQVTMQLELRRAVFEQSQLLKERDGSEAALRENVRLSVLRAEVAAQLASGADLDTSLGGVCTLLVQHLEAAFARIWTLDEESATLVLRASAGLYVHLDGPHGRVRVGEFKIGRIAQSRAPLLTNDVAHDPNISDPAWAAREGMRAFAGYPLILEERLVGVLALFSRHDLTEAVLSDLAPLCESVAQCIQRKRTETELLAAMERAENASRAKDNFLAALSHELRTPLTPVLMTSAALRDDERLPEEVRADLAMIQRNVTLEARLIDDLLDLTRIVKGKLTLREEECDAHSLIGFAAEILRDEAQSKPVMLSLALEARHSGLRGDPVRLQQVFWNLLRNAIKFTPPGGHVTLRTHDLDGDCLGVEVTDTGIGIAPQSLGAIFLPFEQAGRDGDHRFGGLGLGLAIARAVVDLHGGHIRAESAGLGCGATFVVELPGATEQRVGVAAQLAEQRHDHVLMERVAAMVAPVLRLLLLEDHEPTLAVLTRLLSRAGHEVIGTSTVAAAVSAAQSAEAPFDVLISDLGLPDGTGLDAMARLREVQPGLRGIALSGYGMEDDLQRSREAGFYTHLVKPVDFDQLAQAVNKLARQTE